MVFNKFLNKALAVKPPKISDPNKVFSGLKGYSEKMLNKGSKPPQALTSTPDLKLPNIPGTIKAAELRTNFSSKVLISRIKQS